jgi:hypothetical protein
MSRPEGLGSAGARRVNGRIAAALFVSLLLAVGRGAPGEEPFVPSPAVTRLPALYVPGEDDEPLAAPSEDGALLASSAFGSAQGDANPAPGEVFEQGVARPQAPLVTIGGQYRLMFNASNFDFHPPFLTDEQPSQTFFNQRFRTWLTVTPNENVQGYLQVQMGHNLWGDHFEFVKANVAPFFPADQRVGIALRRGYLTYQTDSLGRLRAGVQDWQDSFGQVLASSDWDFNVGGLSWKRLLPALGDADMLFGIFVLNQRDPARVDDAMLLTLDLDWEFSDSRRFGLACYYLPDSGDYSYPTVADYESAWDAWLGMRGSAALGPIPLHAFAIYNPGERRDPDPLGVYRHHGYALKLEAGPIPVGPGRWSVQVLYSSGKRNPDDRRSTEFRTIAQSVRDNFGAQGYWSYLVITSPHGPSDVNDLGVSLQNRGLGLFTVQTKYEYPILPRLGGAIAVGWLRSAAVNPASGATDLGTELANMFTYDFGGGLKADFGASVLFTGNFYRPTPLSPRPDNLYEAFTRLQLEF